MNRKTFQTETATVIQSKDIVTISCNEVPLLLWGGHSLIMAVNFLRCGVPSVQLLIGSSTLFEDEMKYIKSRFELVSLRDETFDYSEIPAKKMVIITRKITVGADS